MKKLLIIALMFWECDHAPTEHTHDTDHIHEGDSCIKVYPSQSYYTDSSFTATYSPPPPLENFIVIDMI